MRASIRTLSVYAALVGGVALLGACDASVTRPGDRVPTEADPLFIGGITWSRTDLPFAPTAINAAGVIVGGPILLGVHHAACRSFSRWMTSEASFR